jgi:hypothetical protein
MSIDQTADADVVDVVRLGQRVSRSFTVALANRATFDAVMALARAGNTFDPHQVARTIGTLFDDAMTVEFGIDESPVLSLEIPFFTGQHLAARTGHGERYTDEQRRDFARRVIAWARTMRADVITVEQHLTDAVVNDEPGEHPLRVRIWWF